MLLRHAHNTLAENWFTRVHTLNLLAIFHLAVCEQS